MGHKMNIGERLDKIVLKDGFTTLVSNIRKLGFIGDDDSFTYNGGQGCTIRMRKSADYTIYIIIDIPPYGETVKRKRINSNDVAFLTHMFMGLVENLPLAKSVLDTVSHSARVIMYKMGPVGMEVDYTKYPTSSDNPLDDYHDGFGNRDLYFNFKDDKIEQIPDRLKL